jgi:hypothetical protein
VWSNTGTTPIADLELQRGTTSTWGGDAFTDYRIRASGGNFILQSQNNATAVLDLLTVDEANNAIKFSPVGVEQMRVTRTASAVNYVQVTGAATGGAINVTAQGSDTNIRANFYSKGTSNVVLGNGAGINFIAGANAGTSANYLTAASNSAGSAPYLAVAGSDTNIDLNLTTKGTGSVRMNTSGGEQVRITDTASATAFVGLTGGASVATVYADAASGNVDLRLDSRASGSVRLRTAGGTEQFRVSHTASAVNYVQVTGAATGGRPTISAQGSDANAGLTFSTKGNARTAAFFNNSATSSWQLSVGLAGNTSAVNYLDVSGSATGFGPVLSAQGSDTNIPLVLSPKGTGALQAQQTDSTATGGNARGANAVDWQTSRGAASQIASGQYSIVAGGVNNTVTSFGGVVGGGSTNQASSNIYTVVGGGLSNATTGERAAIVGGASNTSAGYLNFIGGGFTNSGTSGSAVTTQSGTMNGTTAVTLSGSNANIKVGQYITGTSIAGDTYVAAISGTSLTLSKVASGSSTSTLSFFTPHGVVVGGGNNQATGAYSVILGGGDAGTAANRNVASGDWSVVGGGRGNTASGSGSFVGGGGYYNGAGSSNVGNIASGDGAFIGGGFSNNAQSFGSSILGGNNNLASATYSVVLGSVSGTTRGIQGNTVIPASIAPTGGGQGSSQSALLVLGTQTTDATATVLRSNTSAASTTNQVILPNNSAYAFKGTVIANVTGGGNTKAWEIDGAIKRGANAASTALVGTPTVTSNYADAGASTWAITATADTTNGGLKITFTGQASTTIRVVAKLETTEVTF